MSGAWTSEELLVSRNIQRISHLANMLHVKHDAFKTTVIFYFLHYCLQYKVSKESLHSWEFFGQILEMTFVVLFQILLNDNENCLHVSSATLTLSILCL